MPRIPTDIQRMFRACTLPYLTSIRGPCRRTGLSKSTIGRIWKAFELKPHRADGFKLSNDPQFVEKIYDVVGLYLNPPESAVVLSVDEKSQVQALARSQPAFPMMPGMPEKRTTTTSSMEPRPCSRH